MYRVWKNFWIMECEALSASQARQLPQRGSQGVEKGRKSVKYWEQVRALENECEHLRARCGKMEAILRERMREENDFSWALKMLKEGRILRRKGWHGKGIWIALQRPDEHSKMTLPYLYIVTNGLESDNETAVRGTAPWLASQTDLLAEDWEVME